MDGGLSDHTKNALQTASEQHFFWFHEALKALEEMQSLALDMSNQNTEAFEAAKARFYEARGRCQVELEILKKGLSDAL